MVRTAPLTLTSVPKKRCCGPTAAAGTLTRWGSIRDAAGGAALARVMLDASASIVKPSAGRRRFMAAMLLILVGAEDGDNAVRREINAAVSDQRCDHRPAGITVSGPAPGARRKERRAQIRAVERVEGDRSGTVDAA